MRVWGPPSLTAALTETRLGVWMGETARWGSSDRAQAPVPARAALSGLRAKSPDSLTVQREMGNPVLHEIF